MDAIIILLLLQLKHWYVDFWIQSYQQTLCKGIYGNLLGLSHTLEHVAGTLIVLLLGSFIIPLNPWVIILVAVIDLIFHYHIDFVKMHYGVKDTYTPRFWREFGLDQFAHQLTYLLIVYILMYY